MRKDLHEAILWMYTSISNARVAQQEAGHYDQGFRMGITSGKHLRKLTSIIKQDIINIGFSEGDVYTSSSMCTIPGWFRPAKSWDLLAFYENQLVTAIELKSINSSFGNNTNNRIEESIGSAVDAIEAFKESLFGNTITPPVLGYIMIVRDCDASREINSNIISKHYNIDTVFDNISYLDRFRIFCERLRQKSIYNAVWLVAADPDKRLVYEPSTELTYSKFITTIEFALKIHRA